MKQNYSQVYFGNLDMLKFHFSYFWLWCIIVVSFYITEFYSDYFGNLSVLKFCFSIFWLWYTAVLYLVNGMQLKIGLGRSWVKLALFHRGFFLQPNSFCSTNVLKLHIIPQILVLISLVKVSLYFYPYIFMLSYFYFPLCILAKATYIIFTFLFVQSVACTVFTYQIAKPTCRSFMRCFEYYF